MTAGPPIIAPASEADATEIATLRNAAGERLSAVHGRGHWSSLTAERGVLRGIATSRVLVARDERGVVGTLRLATKKPWAIDLAYFTAVERPLYLLDMAVHPEAQGRGIGRLLVAAAREEAIQFPAQALRLDAYDAPAGAGGFYRKAGFRETGRASYRGVPLVYFELLV